MPPALATLLVQAPATTSSLTGVTRYDIIHTGLPESTLAPRDLLSIVHWRGTLKNVNVILPVLALTSLNLHTLVQNLEYGLHAWPPPSSPSLSPSPTTLPRASLSPGSWSQTACSRLHSVQP